MNAAQALGHLAASAPGRRAVEEVTLLRLRRALAAAPARHLPAVLETVRRARFLADRGHLGQAQRLMRRALALLERVQEGEREGLGGPVMVEAAVTSLDAGVAPRDWERTWSALGATARLADAAWQRGADAQVTELVDMGLRLAFHPELQFGDAGEDTDRLAGLSALRTSSVYRDLTALAGGSAPAAGAPALAGDRRTQPGPSQAGSPSSRPTRLLVAAAGNFTFVRGIVEDYEADPHWQVRVVDLTDTPGLRLPRRRDHVSAAVRTLRERQTTGQDTPLPVPLTDQLRADLAWADTLLVEWGNAAAAWAARAVNLLAPHERPRLVVRLHSYEASTPWPQLTDWTSVDTLITVAPAIRRLLTSTVPALAPVPGATAAVGAEPTQARRDVTARGEAGDAVGGTHVVTLPNRGLLTSFTLPKQEGAGRTLAMVGWAARRKDPAWTLDLLDVLRLQDPSWRLLLIGPDFPQPGPATSPADRAYAREVSQRLAALGPAVRVTGRTTRVAQNLTGAGVIVSSSRREGTHEGFIEAVASGALPVCRRWPDVATWGGPQDLFPPEWIVDTPEQAARRILTLAGQPEAWQEQCSQAQARVLAGRDWQHVRPHYDAVLRAADRLA